MVEARRPLENRSRGADAAPASTAGADATAAEKAVHFAPTACSAAPTVCGFTVAPNGAKVLFADRGLVRKHRLGKGGRHGRSTPRTSAHIGIRALAFGFDRRPGADTLGLPSPCGLVPVSERKALPMQAVVVVSARQQGSSRMHGQRDMRARPLAQTEDSAAWSEPALSRAGCRKFA